MSYTCEIREQAAQPVLSIRTRTPVQELPQAFGRAYGEIALYLWVSIKGHMLFFYLFFKAGSHLIPVRAIHATVHSAIPEFPA